ncbi:MAG: hypothetical protein COA49_04870 [Bacteroidetes bacterium]|nr:MAG: hypothetical protein COA49_04870 [Bacteroidota bacterium]
MFSLISFYVQAQFVDVSNSMSLNTDHTGGFLGTGVSFADFNGDEIDDLTFGHHAGNMRFYQGDSTGFQEVFFNITNLSNETKAVLWADIDNDGDQDFLVTNRNASNSLWINDGGMQFTDVSTTCGLSTASDTKSYGASFGDYDNDGFLDLYICNYHTPINNSENELYHNNGDGTFTNVTEVAGVGNGLKQTFQSTWIDINKDGLLDLHIINDRTSFLNAFYLNNGDGTFSDMAMLWGVDIGIYAMSSTFGDYDRDGDMDLYMTNGPLGNYFFKNDLNSTGDFNDVTVVEGVSVNKLCWGAAFVDYDNNMWPDLYVGTGISSYNDYPNVFNQFQENLNVFFENDGLSPLLDVSLLTPQIDQFTFSIATGDFNGDGFPDLVSHRIGEYATMISGIPNGNHYLKIRPEGVTSNRDAIGAEVSVYHPNGLEYDVVFCGDKYLSQNSRYLHFGLGLSTQVDSVIVHWPGGIDETFTGILVDESIILIEGSSVQFCPNPSEFCGSGTVWDDLTQTCISTIQGNLCPTDVDHDGYTSVHDLILVLTQFGTFCNTTW